MAADPVAEAAQLIADAGLDGDTHEGQAVGSLVGLGFIQGRVVPPGNVDAAARHLFSEVTGRTGPPPENWGELAAATFRAAGLIVHQEGTP